MKYALRALKWATAILWICFVFLVITVVYSAFNIKVELGESKTFVENEQIVWATPIIIDNAGFYDISDLNITVVIKDVNETVLVKNSSFTASVPKKEKTVVWHNVSISLKEITKYQTYLTHDSNFTLEQIISLNFAKIVPFAISVNSTMPWGAPLYNLSVSEPVFQPVNATHSTLLLNVSFENHSPYITLEGTIKVEILNKYGTTVGTAYKSINVHPNSPYRETIEILVNMKDITDSGTIAITFDTPFFSYEMEVQYGSG